MAILQSTTISGSNANTGSLQVTGSTVIFPIIESSLTSSFSGSGKMWINADTQNIQYSFQTSLGTVNSPAKFLGAWSAGGNLPSARSIVGGFGKSQNSSVLVGGSPPNAGTFHYDGKSWSSGGTLITNRGAYHQTAGTEFAGIVAGGFCAPDPGANVTEEYNGSTWASGGSLIQARYNASGAGFQNAMILVGGDGNPSSPYIRDCVEEYNGSSWSAGAAYYRQDRGHAVTGTQTATLAWGGYGPGTIVCTAYNYDGTAWSQTNTALRPVAFGGFFGSANSALSSTGYFSPSVRDCPVTQEWNGSTWIIGSNMIQGRRSVGGSGTTFNGLLAGGRCGTPSSVDQALTEEYTKDYIPPYTTCVWTKGGALITGRYDGGGSGIQNAGLVFAGNVAPTRVTCTEEYDGTVYAAGGAMITARGNMASGGTQNAGIGAGGEPTNDGRTEEYNGSTWSTGGSMSNGGYGMNGNGTQDKFIVQSKQPATTNSEKYNGTSWSATNAMNIARTAHLFIGDSDSGIILGGSPFSPVGVQTEEWDGTNYSSGPDLIFCVRGGRAGGTSNDGLAYGGYNPTYPVGHYRTQAYNGVAFSIDNPLTYSYKGGLGNGTPSAVGSFYAGGYNPGGSPYGGANTTQIASCCSTTLCSVLPVWSGRASMITTRMNGGGFGATSNAAVPLQTAIEYLLPTNFENFFSNILP